MVQGTTPTLLFKFSFDLALAKEWRIIFYQDEENNFPKTQNDCIVDENQVIYIKLTQEETLSFDTNKYLKIQAKALTNDNNVIPSDTITTHVHEILDKALFEIENTPPTIIDTSVIEFHFNEEHCQYGLDFEDLYIEQVSTGGGGNITVDKEFSITSTNPVQNKVISNKINSLETDIYSKTQSHINTNFMSIIYDLMWVVNNNPDYVKVGDMYFSADPNEPDFMVLLVARENVLDGIPIPTVNDIPEDEPKSGSIYYVANYYTIATLDVGVDFEQFATKKQLNEKQDKLTIVQSINEETQNSEDPVSAKAVYNQFLLLTTAYNERFSNIETDMGDIETALDTIIEIQNSLIGGDSE